MSAEPSTSTATSQPGPADPSPSPHLSSPTGSGRTNHELASLLAQAYADLDSLKRELSQTKRRAEKAERLANALSAAGDDSPNGSSATGISDGAARVIRELEERVNSAEMARDEAEARRRMMQEQWLQVEGQLNTLEYRSQETRQSFSRIMKDGGGPLILSSFPLPVGPPGTLTHITAMPPPAIPSSKHSSRHASSRSQGHNTFFPPHFSLPPAPGTTSLRRPRTPSLDSAYPPSKRSRANDDGRGREPRASYSESHIQPHPNDAFHRSATMRVIHSGPDRHPGRPGHSRSSSRSSASSMDLDEILLAAADGEASGSQNGVPGAPGASPNPHSATAPLGQHQIIQSSHRSRQPRGGPSRPLTESDLIQQQQYNHVRRLGHMDTTPPYPASQSVPMRKGDHHSSAAQVQYQTHIFAPPVTGAPIKKSKYSNSSASLAPHGSAQIGSIDTPPQASAAPAPHAPAFPATNAQGQRICRQCGQPGRYKDGKCVEKWGPGPMGPGTVCDRCRKKMKRVERRGTLEAQQQERNQALAAANLANPPHPPVQQHQPHAGEGSGRVLQRTDTIPNASPSGRDKGQSLAANNPPKVSHVRTLVNNGKDLGPNDERGSRTHSRVPSPSGRARESTNGNGNGVPSSTILPAVVLRRSPDNRMDVTDSDADADAEAEAEAEILGAVEAKDDEEEGDAEGDPDAEILEAVEAAERSSTDSHSQN
ncbi:hypothetical protein FA15DRAFT_660411 [Coprinopsis marcescibilis]|uniref:Uncharacterized protein n=1 Tax=Coprinopsis marcescibilis TaxID=230819 RepID=A0A5C3KSQ9_COPMA|nr:hypothetical protein FA15DRAFT_660411 [Coprinopsis marcescibilis]